MELKIYKNKDGHDMNVVEVDAEGKRVKVDYGNGHFHWWEESDYLQWTTEEEQTEDTGEVVLDYITPEETTAGLEHNPITEEPKKKKAAVKKPAKKK